MFKELGEAVGRNVVNDMVRSGQFQRIIENAKAKEFEKMALEPEYAHARDRLIRGAAAIRAKQKKYLEQRTAQFKALSWWQRWTTDFNEFVR